MGLMHVVTPWNAAEAGSGEVPLARLPGAAGQKLINWAGDLTCAVLHEQTADGLFPEHGNMIAFEHVREVMGETCNLRLPVSIRADE